MNAPLPASLAQEASRWVVRMHSDQLTLDDEQAFEAWLARHHVHRDAYEQQAALWARAGGFRDDEVAVAALSRLRKPLHPSHSLNRRMMLAASFGGAAVLAGAAVWTALRALTDEHRYETAMGEQRRIVLADGSAVTLNTSTVLRVNFDEHERRLWLDEGQAFFDVAHDQTRPFRVFVGDDEVRAIGTEFDIRREGQRAKVTLEEGVVALYRGAAAPLQDDARRAPAATLRPGQQAVVTQAEPIQIAVIDARSANAWRLGQIVLENEPLRDALNEINRYNARKIILADASLESMAVSGVFQTGRPEAFVEALTTGFPVEVRSEDDQAIYLNRRGAP